MKTFLKWMIGGLLIPAAVLTLLGALTDGNARHHRHQVQERIRHLEAMGQTR